MSVNKAFEHKKSLGQHFLNSDVVPRWMCDAAELGEAETVLEIGPGTGALTREILARGARVVAIEADARAIEALTEAFSSEIASGQLRVEQGDMRELSAENVAQIFDLRDREYTLIANIPYYLSGHLFRTFLETNIQPKTLIFLVQKEIAARIARDPKESLLSLSVKAFGQPKYIKTVSKGHFTPPPKVDSAIVAVYNISRNQFENPEEQAHFFKLLHLGFGHKRKQLLSNLCANYKRTTLSDIFTELGLPLTVRAEDLALEQWCALTACTQAVHS